MQRRTAGYRARIGRDELIVKTVEKGVETIPFFYPFIQCRRTRYVSRVAASMWQKNSPQDELAFETVVIRLAHR